MDDKTFSFNPFQGRPMSQYFFLGRPLPDELSLAAAERPAYAKHLQSVWQFATWLDQANPAMANIIRGMRPDLLDAGAVVSSGKLTPGAEKHSPDGKLKGLRAVGEYQSGDIGSSQWPLPVEAGASGAMTEWGKTVSDLVGKYLVYDQQRRLIDLNIKRAEQGLAPVDSSAYGVGVNVGLSPQTQKLAMVAIGGLVIYGLVSAFGRR